MRGIRVDLAASPAFLIVLSFRALFVNLEASAIQSKFFFLLYFNGQLEINFTYLPHHFHHLMRDSSGAERVVYDRRQFPEVAASLLVPSGGDGGGYLCKITM